MWGVGFDFFFITNLLIIHYRKDFVMHLMYYYLFWIMEKLHLIPTEQLLTSQDGMVFLVDRKKELIKVKGFQVIQFCRPEHNE